MDLLDLLDMADLEHLRRRLELYVSLGDGDAVLAHEVARLQRLIAAVEASRGVAAAPRICVQPRKRGFWVEAIADALRSGPKSASQIASIVLVASGGDSRSVLQVVSATLYGCKSKRFERVPGTLNPVLWRNASEPQPLEAAPSQRSEAASEVPPREPREEAHARDARRAI